MNRALYLLLFPLLLSYQSVCAQPENVLNELGRRINSGAEKLNEIIEHYSMVIGHHPQNYTYYNNRAAAYFDQGQYRKAIADYEMAIQLVPPGKDSRLARMYYKLGLSQYILQEYAAASGNFNQAIVYRSDVTDSYYFRGKIEYLLSDNRTEANRDFRKVISLSRSPSIQAVFCHYFLEERTEAAELVRKLLASTQASDRVSYSQLNYNLAGLQGLIGNATDAVAYLEVALEYDYADFEWLVRDPNFQPIANQPIFQRWMEEHRMAYLLPAISSYPDPAESPLATRGKASNSLPHTRGISSPNAEDGDLPLAPAALKGVNLSFHDPSGSNRIEAEETTYIRLEIINQGQGKARNVKIQIQEETGLRGLMFEWEKTIGDLYSGASQQIEFPVRSGLDLEEGEANFRLSILEENGFDGDPVMIHVPTQGYQPPQLGVADYQFASELGGNMRTGVPLTLKMAIQNSGPSPAEGVRVDMELPENVFSAGDASFLIGDLAAGESKVIDYEFFTNRRYVGSSVPITAQISDQQARATQTETMTVNINQPLAVMDRVVITPRAQTPQEFENIQLNSDVDRNLPRATRPNPRGVAVIIGNRDYENPDVPPVDFALQDAASMRRYLVESYGFDENNILYLPNATQADFNGVFGTKGDHKARLFNLIKADETELFVFYSGHGAPDLQSEDAYFVPVDCDPSLVRFNGYAIQTFYDNLAQLPYRSLTVVIDACFSGTSDRGTLMPQASLVRIKSSKGIIKDPKAMVFTSATGTQIASWHPTESHSLFTYYFLKGLQGAANADQDRTLSLEEMQRYLAEQVPYMARRLKNRTQTPEVYGQPDKILITY